MTNLTDMAHTAQSNNHDLNFDMNVGDPQPYLNDNNGPLSSWLDNGSDEGVSFLAAPSYISAESFHELLSMESPDVEFSLQQDNLDAMVWAPGYEMGASNEGGPATFYAY